MTDATVFIVDDDADMANSLAWMLDASGFRVSTYCSAASFLKDFDAAQPGCLLLDLCMPRQSGLELVDELSQRGVRIPVVFMTAYADVPTAVEAMKAGAIEFLQKPFERAALVKSLHRALELDREWRSESQDHAQIEGRLNSLTENERLTLQLVVEGNSNKVIASRLSITERAVERRRARIMQKLGVRSLPEALQLAIRHRVISELRAPSLRKTGLPVDL